MNTLPQDGFRLQQAIGQPIPRVRVIDIGAGAYNTKRRYQPLIEQRLAEVIGFEPNEEEFRNLKAVNEEGFTWLPYALGNGGEATLKLTRLPQCSSLYEPDLQLLDVFLGLGRRPRGTSAFEVQARIPLETRRLDDLPECAGADHVTIDVQGAELDILKGATETLRSILVLELEVEFLPLYKEQPLFGDLHCFLASQDFLFHKLLNIQGRPIGTMKFDMVGLKTYSQALWADAVFIQSALLTAPDTVAQDSLLKAALILNDVYQSYDLVHYLLSHYDKRFGTWMSAAYLAALKESGPLKRSYMNLIDTIDDLKAG